jgi:transcription initiation factor IIE alpha subunit
MKELTKEEQFKIMDDMEKVNREMVDNIYKTAPICHFRKMFIDESEYEQWWECSVCGHTKVISTYSYPMY